MNKVSKDEFTAWVHTMIERIRKENISNLELMSVYANINNAVVTNSTTLKTAAAGGYVFVANAKKREVTIIRMADKASATAKCHKDDEFSVETAIAICYARLQNWEIPKIIERKKLSEMKPGEKFIYHERTYKFICQNPLNSCFIVENMCKGLKYMIGSDTKYELI